MKKILILGFYGVGKTTALKDFPNAVDLTDVPKQEG
jgi:predicted NACHT family NTPase